MLKDQLMTEAAELEIAPVVLDSIFESANMPKEAQDQFTAVFEASVRKYAIALAESHITKITESAEALVESTVDERVALLESKTIESTGTFLEHVSKEWLAENAVAIDKGVKADLFESLVSNLKTVFVEHNVVIPEESVDVVAELEDELAEANENAVKLLETNKTLLKEHNDFRRNVEFGTATSGLTESQREQVGSLVEGLEYNDAFSTKLTAIVEMAKASTKTVQKPLVETNINTTINEAGLNYVVEDIKPTETTVSPRMQAYANAL